MNQLLQVLAAEQQVPHQRKNERGVGEERGSRQLRQPAAATPKPAVMKLGAAKLERDLKLAERSQRKALPVKKPLGPSVISEEEHTKPIRRRRNQKDNNNRRHSLTISRRL